ncbi:MAG TPA: hypothetical protein V6D47_11645 [Oscillatoriaceae cyanobacterium]
MLARDASTSEWLAQAVLLTDGLPLLAAVHRELVYLAVFRDESVRRVMLQGPAGAGKTALLNALMGERLLPEGQATRCTVRVRHAPERKLIAFRGDGATATLEGDALAPDTVATWMEAPDMLALEWRSPASRLPAGLVLVEAPASPATAEGVVQALPIKRSYFAESSETFARPALLALTFADREHDSYQGGRIFETRETKLARHAERLGAQLGTRVVPVAPGQVEALAAAIAELPLESEPERREIRIAELVGIALERLSRLRRHAGALQDGLRSAQAQASTLLAHSHATFEPIERLTAMGAALAQELPVALEALHEQRLAWESAQSRVLQEANTWRAQADALLALLELPPSGALLVLPRHPFPEPARYVSGDRLDHAGLRQALESFVLRGCREVRTAVDTFVADVRAGLAPLAASVQESALESTAETFARLDQLSAAWRRVLSGPGPLTPRRAEAASALKPLLATFRELNFQLAFKDVLSRLEIHEGPIVLLGPQRAVQERLLALLRHDLAIAARLAQVPADHWILCGPFSRWAPPGPAVWISPPDGLLARFSLALPPADADWRDDAWRACLDPFAAIGLAIDPWLLPELGASALLAAIAHDERVFYTCGEGAWLFSERLAALDACRRLDGRPWFVHEDYDARYTIFLAQLASDRAGAALPTRWREAGLPLDAPFEAEALVRLVHPFTRGSE